MALDEDSQNLTAFITPEIALVYNVAGVDPQKINAVKHMKDPQNIKQLRSILGFIRFYRNCFEGFKKTTGPPAKLLIKSEKFFLNEACISIEATERKTAASTNIRISK